jgi:hypothetical protein
MDDTVLDRVFPQDYFEGEFHSFPPNPHKSTRNSDSLSANKQGHKTEDERSFNDI